jgi:ATP-binding cassette subfamily B protein
MSRGALSTTDLLRLLSNALWAAKTIFSTNAVLTLGLALATFGRGLVPAGLALFARGLINVFVTEGGPGAASVNAAMPWLLLGFAMTVLEAIGPLVERFCIQRLHDEVNLKITLDILSHCEKLDLAFFEDPIKRDLIERSQQNPAERFMKFIEEAQASVISLLQAASLVAILMLIEPLVLWVLAPFALPYLLFRWRLSQRRYQEEYQRTPQRRWTSYFVALLTGRQSVAEIKLLDLGPYLREKFRSLMTQFRNRDRSLHRRSLTGSSLFALATTVAFFLIFYRVVVNVGKGVLTLGDLAVFGAATSRLRYSLEATIRGLSGSMEHALFISNLIEFFNERPRMPVSPAAPSPSYRGEIELKSVSFTYPGSSELALRDVSLHIRPGETVAVVGENGAGKTTLVKLLARLYDPDSGSIEFDGIDLKTLSPSEIHGRIGFVLQDFGRYEASAADNIAYGDWRVLLGDRRKVEQTARLAGVDEMVRAMPEGYDTTLGRLFGAHELSKGQWQRLAVARAFARDAAVLILDEPAASLSVQAEYELFCRFHELSRGRTTILISHRFSTLSIADRILVMDKGRIIESGSHQELLARAGNYARLYRLHRNPLRSMAAQKTTGKLLP